MAPGATAQRDPYGARDSGAAQINKSSQLGPVASTYSGVDALRRMTDSYQPAKRFPRGPV